MGKWFGPQTGDCSCCIEGGLICGCTADTYPTNVSVTLSGWTDFGDCNGCNEYMGTYALYNVWDTTPCRWDNFADGISSPCTSYSYPSTISVTFSDDGVNTVVVIVATYLQAGAPPLTYNWIKYKKTFSGHIDCAALIDEPIPYDSHYQAAGQDECDYGVTIDDALLTTV